MENTKANTVLNYCNDVFFKYTLSREDEGSVYARNTIIERVTGIKVKESTVQNPNLDPGTIGKKRIILDVHVKDEKGRFFNLEMQTTYAGVAEMMRFEFYGARALNNQLDSSEKYKDLKPVYQIIFIEKCAWNNKNLINHYQMRNEQGEDESKHPLIRRTYIHLPVINEIAKKKAIQQMDDFEQLCFLFENNAKNDIRYGLEDSFEEGMKEGIIKGKAEGKVEGRIEGERQLLHRLMEAKYQEDCTAWLQSLTEDQLHIVSSLILKCDTLEAVKKQVHTADTM
ncbi:PD-(D/E)XK nuclease family transposase [[Clostridium] innocuum]|uniref:PD-(D/E)XK nuclease family transposase n=1 Tax=Clostridium innocuum TaxID=1522 RepID=UPI0006C5A132|nr:PD-(D/E)XK nuclease family transposase [[Clostridium] innocuum]CUQ92972.1 flagellar assembly protein H [[Clostridium] innocuum]